MREEYIQSIEKMLHRCDDISLLDFIFQLLQKSQEA